VLKPLFKGLKLAPFVECANCHALSEHGTKQCKSCGAEMISTGNSRIFIVALNLGARYTPFVECPNCQKLVRVGVNRCPDCYENIPEGYALNSAAAIVANTVACDVANSIKAFDSFAVLAAIGSVPIYFLDLYVSGSPKLFYLVILWSVMPLMTTLLWLYRFGNFKLGDDEYLRAKRGVRRSLTLWLALTSAQIIALGTWWL
jgi:RNA polymerase subunit RPABC4/transcription elongation factor Spt4